MSIISKPIMGAIQVGEKFSHNDWIRVMRLATNLPDVLLPIITSYVGHAIPQVHTCEIEPYVVSFSPDDKQVAIGGRGQSLVTMYDMTTFTKQFELKGHTGDLTGLSFSHDGKCLVTASDDNTAGIWCASTGQLLHRLTVQSDIVLSACFNHDDSLVATGSFAGKVNVYDAKTGKCVRAYKGQLDHHVTALCFNGDGTDLASADRDGIMTLWDVNTGQVTDYFKAHDRKINTVACSHTNVNNFVTASNDGTACIWDTRGSRRKVKSTRKDQEPRLPSSIFLVDDKRMKAAAFRPSDDQYVVTAGYDTTKPVCLWDLAADQHYLLSDYIFGPARAAAFTADGTQLMIASKDRKICIFNLW